jgi:hypothetical protein
VIVAVTVVASSLRFLRRCLPVHLEYVCTLQEAVTMLSSHVLRTTTQHTLCTNYNATSTGIVERYRTHRNQIARVEDTHVRVRSWCTLSI